MSDILDSGALWYASRATGLVSLLLLTAVVLLGVVGRSSRRLWGLPRFAVTALHRNLALLVVVFLAVHIASVVIDPYVTIRWTQVILPWGGDYRPIWVVGLGTVAFDVLLALVLTSLLRVRIGPRVWRSVHWLAYAAWPIAVTHGLGAGSDMASGWPLAVTIGLIGAVAVAVGWRLTRILGRVPRAQQVPNALARSGSRSRVPAAPARSAPKVRG